MIEFQLHAGDPYRKGYVDGIEVFLKRMNQEAESSRNCVMTPQIQERNRSRLRELLGTDLYSANPSQAPQVSFAGENDLAMIYRLQVFLTDEIPFYALLLLPKNTPAPTPLIIAQHGGGGTPELCSDLCGKNNYNGMVRRCLQRGAAVLAPQLLLWVTKETETQRGHDIPYDRVKLDAQLKRFGSSITGLEIVGIQRCLDYACTLEDIDADRIGMMGLSYGGYFTLHTMALEPRIKAGYSAAAFNSRDVHCLVDWSYKSAAFQLQDAEIAALCAPRKLYIQVGRDDTVFDYRSAIAEAERAAEYFAQLGAKEHFCFDVWSGGHTVSHHDEGYNFLFGEL